ncbi:MAG: TolC family protein [Syntrophus sp. (in: bacteria)]|nr:TolC family protein [Syntrophus sp. (in: bacteria)]
MNPRYCTKHPGMGRLTILLLSFVITLIPFISKANEGLRQIQPERNDTTYTLPTIIRYSIKNNPNLRISGKDIESQTYWIDSAKADRMPKIDLGGGLTRYRYDMPLTPIVITPPLGGPGTEIPEFKRTIWDTGVSFKLPLFKGGRLYRGVKVAEMQKAIAQDHYSFTKQELIYNLSSVYYKIAQLEKLLIANDASVQQLEVHKGNVDLFLKTGTAPQLDLLKTNVDLAHAIENKLLVKNNLQSTYEFLKTLMGMDDMATNIVIAHEKESKKTFSSLDESMAWAFSRRPDYMAAAKKVKIGEERVKIAQGKRYPDIYAAGQYGGQAGNEFAFKENYYFGMKFVVPLFDGGLITSEINKEKAGLEKAREEERALKLSITREVRDAHLNIANATERITVTEKAITSARENLRVEMLKYDTGAGTSQDVIDARTALLRTETDFYQGLFDRNVAIAYLAKATGEAEYDGEVEK